VGYLLMGGFGGGRYLIPPIIYPTDVLVGVFSLSGLCN
jgi:hypothetical protein